MDNVWGGSLHTLSLVIMILSAAHAFLQDLKACGGRAHIRTSVSMILEKDKGHKAKRQNNAPGNLFVDRSCIDCDTCRWMAPTVFKRDGDGSIVYHQPEGEEEKRRAFEAMVACPTGSIRLEKPDPLMKAVINDFPLRVDEAVPNVYHLGFHSPKSYGGAPWLICTQECTVMMDSPRFSTRLAAGIVKTGGGRTPKYMVLSHIDDVADHALWQEHFPDMQRIMHRADTAYDPELQKIEKILDDTNASKRIASLGEPGLAQWDLTPELTIIHTPGHTRGCITLIYTPEGGDGVAFTGDHLAASESGKLTLFPRYNRAGIKMQAKSVEMLATPEVPDFRWILPGHGRSAHFSSKEERIEKIKNTAREFASHR